MNFVNIIILSADIFVATTAYQIYQNSIPNGAKVPHPCNSSVKWAGVGHTNPLGGGQRNQFGEDFDDNNHIWTRKLCEADSDGDGRTNGDELGDPRCVWSPLLTPERTSGITNPGICEPWNSENCAKKQPWLKCQTAPCASMTEPGVRNTTLRYSRTNIPAQATTYRCLTFKLPSDNLYDVVATAATVDNVEAVHHMVLYACNDRFNSSNMGTYDCEMGGPPACTGIMVVWSKGFGENCFSPEYGFRIGTSKDFAQNGTKFVVLQIHWTNLALNSNLFDSSGLTLYYTANLRPNRADILQIVQLNLFIPPKLSSYQDSVVCASHCTTSSLKAPVKITQGHVHMHLLGKYGLMIQKRKKYRLRLCVDPTALRSWIVH